MIKKEEEPTDWVSSLVVTEKPNGKLRVCIDPQHLNKALKRSHYRIGTLYRMVNQYPIQVELSPQSERNYSQIEKELLHKSLALSVIISMFMAGKSCSGQKKKL